jgi:hypothetical protein
VLDATRHDEKLTWSNHDIMIWHLGGGLFVEDQENASVSAFRAT